MEDPRSATKRPPYEILITLAAERDFKNLDAAVRERVFKRLEWLAVHADVVVHHALTSLPDDLKGLCRLRAGNWRVLYWVYHDARRIVVYGVSHRRDVYQGV